MEFAPLWRGTKAVDGVVMYATGGVGGEVALGETKVESAVSRRRRRRKADSDFRPFSEDSACLRDSRKWL